MTPKQMARLGVFQIQEAILSVLEEDPEGLEPESISERLGIPDASIVQGVLNKLQQEGYIEPPGEGRWKIASSDNGPISSNNSDIWTAEKFFKEWISGKKYEKRYNSKGQIERLSKLGADLMNLIDQEQWGLRPKFNKLYVAFYSGRSPYFGVDLASASPRLCIWLPKKIVIDKENARVTDNRHEIYSNWANSTGSAVYPSFVEVVDIEGMLKIAYAWRQGAVS
ncbi:MAG: hypothetical protein OXN27_17030 [Candidatus Poribacteria bacterium]|nr:hypothetical protein [Candidatus Poribacteria bacterium]